MTTYKVTVTYSGQPGETATQNHLAHDLHDLPERLQQAVAMMDAALEWDNPEYTQAKTLNDVGTKVFLRDDRTLVNGGAVITQRWPEYYVSELFAYGPKRGPV